MVLGMCMDDFCGFQGGMRAILAFTFAVKGFTLGRKD